MKKLTKILSLSLAFMLSLATAIPTVSVAADPIEGSGTIQIRAYSITNGDEKTGTTAKDMTGRSFTAYRILEGTADSSNPNKVSYKVPDAMKNFYQTYEGFSKAEAIALTENRLIAQVDPSTSVQAAAYDNKMSGVDIMKAIAEIDPQIEFVGPVQSSESDIMPLDLGTDLDGDLLDEAVLENLNDMADGSKDLQKFADAALAAAKTAGAESKTSTIETLSDTTKVASINDLKYGYYVIEETTSESGIGKAISTTLLTAVHATETVNLISKDVAPTVSKYITTDGNHTLTKDPKANTANIGDTVSYKIVANLPDVQGYTTYTYKVEDTFGDGLDFDDDAGISVWFYPDKDTAINLTAADYNSVNGGKYGNDPIKLTDGKKYTYDEDARKLTVEFNSDWILKNGINGIANVHSHAAKPTTTNAAITIPYVVITYSATVNSNATIGGTGNVNKVDITYSNKPSDSSSTTTTPPDTPDSKTTTYVYAVDLYKTGYKDGDILPLKDAHFRLQNKNDDANKDKYATLTFDSAKKTYTLTGWDDTGTTIISTDDPKFVRIIGIEAGKYAFVEDSAPENYEPIEGSIGFTVSIGSDYSKPTFTKDSGVSAFVTVDESDTDGIGKVTVENTIDALLPGTGGVGRVMVYALGSILVLGAAVLFVLKRRSGKNA